MLWTMPKSHRKPIALSFFSGAMGMDIGLEKAGFETRLVCEVDKACQKTISRNRPDIPLIGDIFDFGPEDILAMAGLKKDDEIDLIVGGPPCQAFSTAGKRKAFEDERGNVFLHFIDLITTIKPKFAVIENVRGLLSAPLKHRPHTLRGGDNKPLSKAEMPGGALSKVIRLLEKAGYGVSFNLYNAANFGTPQKRERVVIICSRDGAPPPFLEPTHSETGAYGLNKWRTFEDAVADLNAECHFIPFPEKRLRSFRKLGPGQNWRALPVEMQKEALGRAYWSGGGKSGFLRRLAWDKPSPTLVTHPAMPATDLAHPVEDRPLSIEEYKRIQEFPDNWVLEGRLLDQYKQIGNAVPVGLGLAIGKHLLKLNDGIEIGSFPEFPYSRYRNTDHISWKSKFGPHLTERPSANALA